MGTRAQNITRAVNWAIFQLKGRQLPSWYLLTREGLKLSPLSHQLLTQIEADLKKLKLSLEKDRITTIEELRNEHDTTASR